MKYGLLYYKDTDNIGDDIQAYASSRFLPRIDYMIDRESLDYFVPKKKECVKTIMNAWYVHDKFNFGISPFIYPLFVSVFFKRFPYESGINVGIDYINDGVVDTLKKYSPIGTRDKHTLNVMNSLNLDGYFSGCMTLTLDKFDNVKKGNYIVTVGLSKKENAYIRRKTKREVVEFVQDVKKGSFSDESWDERKERVENALKLYQGAHLVITNKLHCSLPCLALETPVLLLYDTSFKENQDRIGTYLPYLNHINRKDLFTSNLNFETPRKNPKKYLELRENLIKLCEDFIADKDKKNLDKLPDPSVYEGIIKKEKAQKDVMLKHLNLLIMRYEKECKKAAKMKDKINNLSYINNELNEELSMIKNSKGWRMLEKMRKLARK